MQQRNRLQIRVDANVETRLDVYTCVALCYMLVRQNPILAHLSRQSQNVSLYYRSVYPYSDVRLLYVIVICQP